MSQVPEPRSKSLPPRVSFKSDSVTAQPPSAPTRGRASRTIARQELNRRVRKGARSRYRKLSPQPSSPKKEYRNPTKTPNKKIFKRKCSPRHKQDKPSEEVKSSPPIGILKQPATSQHIESEQSPGKKIIKEQRTLPICEGHFNYGLANSERSTTVADVHEDRRSSPSKYFQRTDRIPTRRLPSLDTVLGPSLTLHETLDRLRLLSCKKARAEYSSERIRMYKQNCSCIAAAVPIKSGKEFSMNNELSMYSRSSPPSPTATSPAPVPAPPPTYARHRGTYGNLASASSRDRTFSDLQGYRKDRSIESLSTTDHSVSTNQSPRCYLKNSKI